jgi:hypothetical protein
MVAFVQKLLHSAYSLVSTLAIRAVLSLPPSPAGVGAGQELQCALAPLGPSPSIVGHLARR